MVTSLGSVGLFMEWRAFQPIRIRWRRVIMWRHAPSTARILPIASIRRSETNILPQDPANRGQAGSTRSRSESRSIQEV